MPRFRWMLAAAALGSGCAADTTETVTDKDVIFEREELANELEELPPEPSTTARVCGTQDWEDVGCHAALDPYTRPVAKLTYIDSSDGVLHSCTAWLVPGANANTMITNNHCIPDAATLATASVIFNYQTTSCTDITLLPTTTNTPGVLLRTSATLDYTLFTITCDGAPCSPSESPEARWGELTPTTKAAKKGNLIYIPQHPNGVPKVVSYFDDQNGTRCKVKEVDKAYLGYPRGTQTGYTCDTDGGSSGSPVIFAGSHLVHGLHHVGDVGTLACRNAATEMSAICADAGSLISCVNN
jgi:hypothetical protein